MEPLLDVKDLRVAFFTKNGVVHAVNGLTYSLAKGDTLGIVGESGSGKSVSLLAMMRIDSHASRKDSWWAGAVQWRRFVKVHHNHWCGLRGKQIGMIFQDPMTSLNPVMSIGNQIDEASIVNLGLSAKQARKRTIEVLSLVGIPNAADRCHDYPHQFSGGMRQRAMIAMAISCRPQLLIADEPTTALDVTIQAQIIDLVKRLQKKLEMTVIWVTHDLGVVARLTNRIIVMYGGRIMESGPVKTIYSQPAHPYTIGLLNSVPGANVDRNSDLHFISRNTSRYDQFTSGLSFCASLQ